jgi:quinol monooxygenase YgiN
VVTEIANITIDPADAAAFEAAVAQAAPCFEAAEGCRGMALRRVIEDPSRYLLVVEWETIEHHMVGFRNSTHFQEWRRLAGPFFKGSPSVEHSRRIVEYF